MFANFNENFAVVLANTTELKQESFKLRYQIFCLEKECCVDPAEKQYLTECETDEHDDYSIHCLLLYKPTQKFIGTVRLIYPKMSSNKLLPIEIIASSQFYQNIIDYKNLPREHLAEISRLAVLPNFRPKFAVLGLLRAIAQVCYKYDIYYTYAAMEPHLQRILERLGINFHAISPLVSYHGMRQCFIGALHEIAQQTYLTHPEIWEVLTDNGELYPLSKKNQPQQTTNNNPDDPNEQGYNYY